MTPEDLKMRDLYHSVIVMSSTRQAIDALRAAIQAAVADERAACAALIESREAPSVEFPALRAQITIEQAAAFAAAIRARGATPMETTS